MLVPYVLRPTKLRTILFTFLLLSGICHQFPLYVPSMNDVVHNLKMSLNHLSVSDIPEHPETKTHFFLDSEQRSEHWGNKRPCTCFGGSQGKEVGGDEGNPSLEPADVSDMGREEFFTQEITVFNLELATRVYIFGAFRWKSNFLTALLTWMI